MVDFLLILCILSSPLVSYSLKATVLVTGGAGFIGYHLSNHLLEQGYRVVVLDNFNSDYDVTIKKARATLLNKKGATVHQGDACDKPLLIDLFKSHSFSTVVHLASRTSIEVSIKDPVSLAHSNVECQMIILQVLKQHKSTRLVYASSSDTVANSTSNSIPPPRNLYAALKMASLELAIKYCFENSLNIIGVRPFTVYGPLSRPDSDVFKAATSIRSKSPVELYKTSSEEAFSRDFVFVDDVVRGIIAAIRYPYVSCDKVFNLGSGSLVSMERIVHLLKTELNAKADIKYVSVPVYEMDQFPADLADTQKSLSFHPKVSIEEGIKIFSKWFLENQGRKPSFSEPSHSLRDKVEKDYIKQKNKEMFERLRGLKEKYANYLKSKGRPTAILYKPKNFIEMKGKYVSGGDGARTMHSGDIEGMKEVCRYVDECLGFTSDGHLKQYIPPKHHWSQRSGSSLFVADINVCEAGMHNCYGNYTCTHLGPAQFKCGCVEGWALVDSNHCVELYKKGHETEIEKEQRIGDKVTGRDWETFRGDAEFIPFKGKESPEGNLAYYPEAKGNAELLRQACMESYHCMGFNTNGLLKKIIRQPSKWKSSSGTLHVLDVDYCHMALSCPRGRHCRKLSPGKYDCT